MPDDRIVGSSPSPTTKPVGTPPGAAAGEARPGSSEHSLRIPLSSYLLNLGAQLVFGLAVGLLLLVGLWLSGAKQRTVFVGSAVGAVAALVLTRGLIRWPLPREVLARQQALPSHIRPSESAGREVVETIVFVVVLVLLLKSFAAEAFVIPTGSMAETLYGYQKEVKCPSCGVLFPVNCSNEVDPQDGRQPVPVTGCTCPNCFREVRLVDPRREGREARPNVFRQEVRRRPDDVSRVLEYVEVADPGWSSGDRVLVDKFSTLRPPFRLEVIVFKYPEGPQKNYVAMNYIKRLLGLPGETLILHRGDAYVLPPGRGPAHDDSEVPLKDRWEKKYMHANDLPSLPEGAVIIRKAPDILLSMMRPVYDSEHPAEDLKGKEWQRWTPEDDSWEILDNGKQFRRGSRSEGGVSWLRYHHRVRHHGGSPALINDFMGYNSNESLQWDAQLKRWNVYPGDPGTAATNGEHWVGDLSLECEVRIEKNEGEFVLELVHSKDVFRARWDLGAGGLCTLTRSSDGGEEVVLDRQPTRLSKGRHRVRLANADRRLTVWVDGQLPFGDGVPYERDSQVGPTTADLRPASIGVRDGAVTVSQVKLLRDTYYTSGPNDHGLSPWASAWTNPTDEIWRSQRERPPYSMYVQPGHYLCLGDNSPQSADSRSWGLVPERLLLGRAVLVYYPFGRAGKIR